jgi:hypothetical protein
MMLRAVAFTLLIALAACGRDATPAGTPGDEAFAAAYAKLIVVSSDPARAPGTTPEQVLKDAGMTPEEFRKRVGELNRTPQRWGEFMERVQKIVEQHVARNMRADSLRRIDRPDSTRARSAGAQ